MGEQKWLLPISLLPEAIALCCLVDGPALGTRVSQMWAGSGVCPNLSPTPMSSPYCSSAPLMHLIWSGTLWAVVSMVTFWCRAGWDVRTWRGLPRVSLFLDWVKNSAKNSGTGSASQDWEGFFVAHRGLQIALCHLARPISWVPLPPEVRQLATDAQIYLECPSCVYALLPIFLNLWCQKTMT